MSPISVFVSRPTAVNAEQGSFCDALDDALAAEGLYARTLGVTDYPARAPLAEVLDLMLECSGALVLGLRQAVALERPLLVARENGVEGGVFDVGSSDRFIHQVEFGSDWLESPRFRQPFETWVADVRSSAGPVGP